MGLRFSLSTTTMQATIVITYAASMSQFTHEDQEVNNAFTSSLLCVVLEILR